MRILITGIGGFVGPRLTRHLLAQGDEVAGTYVEVRPQLPGHAGIPADARIDLHEADLLDPAALARVFAAVEPEAVIHLAGLAHVGESWKRMGEYFRVNVLGTENLLHAAKTAGRRPVVPVVPVVIASSAEIYGAVPVERQPIREEEVADPRTPYAMTKAAAERLAYAHGAVVVRAFNMVGPGQSPAFALPAFAAQLAAIGRGEQEPVLKVGNLSARRDFVHVDDGVAGFRVVVEKGERGGTYNLASGEAVSIGEALARLQAVSGVAAQVVEDPERMRPVDLPLLVGDNRRLRGLGWSPKRGLDQALADLWASQAGPAR